ncbi:hypothetical protein AVEN_234194-1 [Araneus ventricosus]|uniref:Uncharacterized protein n=1 Tax=Araneus ventricosus TaxID=182803 RepID=A0A4Y2GPA9_ARAVE|nr:hypothetical protein AVEN_234194-1 [Araneus ventricosus]
MSRPAIVKWCQQFEVGRTDLTDAEKYNHYYYIVVLRNNKRFVQSCGKQETWKVKQRHCPLARQFKTSQGTHNTRFASQFWRHPPYSPDLAPCDFHVFGKPREHLGGRQFSNDDQVQTAVLSWLQNQGAIFCRQGIE